jgi:Tfp pilus assembly protein PilV
MPVPPPTSSFSPPELSTGAGAVVSELDDAPLSAEGSSVVTPGDCVSVTVAEGSSSRWSAHATRASIDTPGTIARQDVMDRVYPRRWEVAK